MFYKAKKMFNVQILSPFSALLLWGYLLRFWLLECEKTYRYRSGPQEVKVCVFPEQVTLRMGGVKLLSTHDEMAGEVTPCTQKDMYYLNIRNWWHIIPDITTTIWRNRELNKELAAAAGNDLVHLNLHSDFFIGRLLLCFALNFYLQGVE